MTVTATKNSKQQQHLAVPVVVAGMGMGMAAAPWFVRTKLLLYAALGFALGVAVTVSIMGSSSYNTSTVAVLRGGALGLFFPTFPPSPAPANLSPPGVIQDPQLSTPPQQAAPMPATIRSDQSRPPVDTGANTAPAADVPPPPVVGVGRVQQSPPPVDTGANTAPDADVPPPPVAGVGRVQQPPPPHPQHPPPPHPQQPPPQVDNGLISAATPPPSPPAPSGGAEAGPAGTGDSRGGGGFIVLDDEELLVRAASAPREPPAGAGPKVAFLFLTRWDLPMAPLWDKFFEGHAGLYSVYVHTDPAFNGPEPPAGSAFFRRTIPSKEVTWGHVSMVEAERRLLAHALLDDPSNARFVLLSESHVPLFDLPTVHAYLVNSAKVFLESYDEPGATGRGRYHRGMRPVLSAGQWRKGSQWFEMDRGLAADVVADRVYFPVFKRFCKRNCYADEHYLPTFLHVRRPAAGANRSLTWVDWSRGGPHPGRFTRMQVTVDFLRWLRGGSKCTYNGETTTVCFLFARKFLPNSLTRFLRFTPKVMGFG